MNRILVVAALAAPLGAWTSGSKHLREPVRDVMRHRLHQTHRPSTAAVRGAGIPAVLPDAGNIAIVDDSDGVFTPGGFDLDQKTLDFRPEGADAARYSFRAGDLRFDQEAARGGTRLALGDDDSREVALPFPFPFYGKRYNRVFVHSDGNLTFESADHESDARDGFRLVTRPPRIAAFFIDLDPTQVDPSEPDAGVRHTGDGSRFVVTWNKLPLYSERPGPTVPRQTFQAILYPDGRIEVSFRQIAVSEAAVGGILLGVVGLAPGDDTRLERVTVVDFSFPQETATANAIVEEFFSEEFFSQLVLAQKFYKNHDDAYDFLVVFNTGARSFTACAEAGFVRNWTRGLGALFGGLLPPATLLVSEELDASRDFGSAGRLQTFIYMGPLSRYPDDPEETLAPGTACGRNSVLTILGQEAGHRFGAYTRFVDPETNRPSTEMLGRDNAHWSFFLNSEASFLEGNEIEDKGSGELFRFETKAIVQRYSRLDQYLMGLRGPEEVPDTFLVRNPDPARPRGTPPLGGQFFNGTRLDVTLPMIVAAEGPRRPDHTLSPKTFRFAFILLVPSGTTASSADIAKLERIRSGWETFFAQAVGNRGRAETRLVRQLALSVWPAAGLIQGRTVNATVTLSAAAAAPVTVTLAAGGPQVRVPGSVTIPAGQRSAEFSIAAETAGVTELVARGPDESYETARAYLSVRSGGAGLRLERLSNLGLFFDLVIPAADAETVQSIGPPSPSPVVFRVRDENFLPYPGLRVTAAASGSGSASPAAAVTDPRGWVELRWTLDKAPGSNTLDLSVEGLPEVRATARARGVWRPSRQRPAPPPSLP